MHQTRIIVSTLLALTLLISPSVSAQVDGPSPAPSVTDSYDDQIKGLEDKLENLRDARRLRLSAQHPPAVLSYKQRAVCKELGLDTQQIARLEAKPLYMFDEAEVDVYLRYLCALVTDLPRRVARLARKNIGQPYELYLLGEMPFEHYDPQPIYSLGKSDCLVYAEHTYAMALTDNWTGFIRMLQRIRYMEGQIGVVTRNHYTEADWNTSNNWLVRDITAELARGKAQYFKQKIDRSKFLRNRYHLETDIPVEAYRHVFIRFEDIDLAKARLREGDFVNIVRGTPAPAPSASKRPGRSDADANAPYRARHGRQSGADNQQPAPGSMQETFGGRAWVGHTGLIVLGEDGEVHLIHSASPSVQEESLDDYIARATKDNAQRDAKGKPRLLGFKFLRLQKDPLKNLRELDGDHAPNVTLPGGERWE